MKKIQLIENYADLLQYEEDLHADESKQDVLKAIKEANDRLFCRIFNEVAISRGYEKLAKDIGLI